MDAMAQALIARAKMLVNNDLKRICKEEGRIQSGNKAQLQTRVIDLINTAVADHDMATLDRLKYRIQNHGEAPPAGASTDTKPYATTPLSTGSRNPAPAWSDPYIGRDLPRMRPSPFYEIQETLLGDIILEQSPQHRNMISKNLMLAGDLGMRLKQDSSLKILLFSHVDNQLLPFAMHDVAFPTQFEVKVNGDEVKANYKGLKNKPGSTRPADMTDYVRKTPPNYRNVVQITYALTPNVGERYRLYICLVKKHTSHDLAQQILKRRVITKQSVLDEMKRKAQDPDIEVESITLSLKDPVSTLRITVPCRGTVCNHTRCFDAESFLQLQEQAPTWTCPICSKILSWEALAVDQYVQEILQTVSDSTDQVTIEPDGKWSYDDPTKNNAPYQNGYSNDDSDDDLIEVTDHRLSAVKNEFATTPLSMTRTPPLSSREASSAPRTGSKRKSEVIDLTLSDDDEEPVRPTKKVNSHQTTLNFRDTSSRHQNPPSAGSYSSARSFYTPPSHSYPPPTLPPSNGNITSHQRVSNSSFATPVNVQGRYGSSYANLDRTGSYLPPPRPSYPGQGTSSFPTYLDSSP